MSSHSSTEEHVGEWKVTIRADTLEELFAEAARVVARSCDTARGAPGEWEPVSLEARDRESLLADWINELLGRSEVYARAYDDVRMLRIDGARLEGEVRGTPVEEWRSALKAATYHGLSIEREDGGWRAVVLLDI